MKPKQFTRHVKIENVEHEDEHQHSREREPGTSQDFLFYLVSQ